MRLSSNITIFVKVLLLILFVGIITLPLINWLVMILWGNIAAICNFETISYWKAFSISIPLYFLFHIISVRAKQ